MLLFCLWMFINSCGAAVFSPESERDVHAFINSSMQCRHIPGMTVAIVKGRVKSGKFGHQVNSDTHLQTVSIMSRLIRIFTVCLGNLFYSNI